MGSNGKKFVTAAQRWEGVGPYYAMFPARFANRVIKDHTASGDMVLDPFAGRGTTVFSAATLGRRGLGVEISPVGWVYAKTKIAPAPMEQVETRLQQIADEGKFYAKQALYLPKFFRKCFSPSVRRFLLAARACLNWRKSPCDRTLMAILLVYLHGKEGQALSNQMRQTKAMSPDYALNWWAEHGKKAPAIDPAEFIRQRIHWRYAKGTLQASTSQVRLGNSIALLPQLKAHMHDKRMPKAKLLLTSPPYFGVTNYHYDQWLRLWLLGFSTNAYVARGPYQGRFTNPTQYRALLHTVFHHSAEMVQTNAVIYVRTSKDPFTKKTTVDILRDAFPKKHLIERSQPFRKPTQTHLFGDRTPKLGEVDLILLPQAQ